MRFCSKNCENVQSYICRNKEYRRYEKINAENVAGFQIRAKLTLRAACFTSASSAF